METSLRPNLKLTIPLLSYFYRLDDHYNTLQHKLSQRQQKLLDALALYKLYSEADLVKSWVIERVMTLQKYFAMSSM